MKVILLAPTPPPSGGIASWTMRMLSCRLKNDWKVDVVDEKVIGDRETFGDKTQINLVMELRRTFNIWKNLNGKLKDPEVSIVHSNIPAGLKSMLRELGCLIITKLNRKKFIIHYRCTIPNMVKSGIDFLVFKLLTRYSDAVIALNTPSKQFTEQSVKTPVYLIPNFVEQSSIKKSEDVKNNKNLSRVLYVGGVIPEKGCLEIVETSKYFPEIEFRLIGKVSSQVKDSIITDNVVIMGEQTREVVEKEMEQADIFMFPSYFLGEGFSNALVEAMGKGLPCIVTEWAANSDMIEDKGGIVVPIKNVEALIKAIEQMKDYEVRRVMSAWNIKKVLSSYTESIVTSNYVDLYEEMTRKDSKG